MKSEARRKESIIHLMERSMRSLLWAFRAQWRPAVIIFIILAMMTGVAYPLLVTGAAQALFPHQANGSAIVQDGKVVGSELIGQPFSDPRYFWGRPSATPSFEYNSSLSGGTNYATDNPALEEMVQARIDALHASDPNNTQPIPSDLVTASASGLDPHISVASAYYQLSRVARERNMSEEVVQLLIEVNTDDRQLGILGESTVNVLELNLALDKLGTSSQGTSVTMEQAPDERVLGMTTADWLFLASLLFLLGLGALATGRLLAAVYDEGKGRITQAIERVESYLYRPARIGNEGMTWKMYAFSLLLFNLLGFLFLLAVILLQPIMPFNPQGLGPVPLDTAFNAAVSFTTNTDWQSYAGETTMSYFTQMVGLTVQNFLSAATGLTVAIALIRGIRQRNSKDLGNFWRDVTRATLILLPLCFVLSLVLVSQGCVQSLDGAMQVQLLQPVVDSTGDLVTVQTIPLGPVASQEAIKLLGTNGGGFFNANSAHPFENPTALTNLIEIIALLIIPAGLCFTFGRMVRDRRQGVALFAAMMVIFVAFLGLAIWAEEGGNAVLSDMGVSQIATEMQPGGNMEGKELRFGVVPSCTFAAATTSTSCGAVDSMHDSYTPLGGLSPLFLIQFGEVVFGGVGTGLSGMMVFVIIAVFVSGLMIGRMPDYLGKKIGPYEMKLCTIIILLPIVIVLAGTALAVMVPEGRAAPLNPGPHGFTEILYAFSSAANNNGSAFAGLSAGTPFYNIALAIAMLLGRYPTILLILALAGALGTARAVPPSPGSLPTHTPLFIFWLIGIIVLLGALSYFLTLALGPIVDFLMAGGG
ncbi:MAG: potassium-transporting ATPase subunit A [Methanomassiliicoccales archaeon PtaU1.Bin030]|nr:MAG: potassium-transporting ATPase subunit A [Methanomassiliicoccales archaeon PtaU1.Bin030]